MMVIMKVYDDNDKVDGGDSEVKDMMVEWRLVIVMYEWIAA